VKKLWGGSFGEEMNSSMEKFNASIGFDWRLYRADIRGSVAYAKALERAGLITTQERDLLAAGLEEVLADIEAGRLSFSVDQEDIHTAVEGWLVERVGPVAGKLHTGRSRNDQVATDVRLYLMEATDRLCGGIGGLQRALVDQAEKHVQTLMPGYTHLQRAQPVSAGHHLMAYFWMLHRDRERLEDGRKRIAVLPLGSGALAGHSLGIDRDFLARELGFSRVSDNSMDAVGDRDFALEFLATCAILAVHISRLAEDLILWCSAEFGFAELSQEYCTGSSLMPQKRNPDSLELARGKTGRTVGNLVALLATMKGLPMTYNKDLQEDKEPLFDTADSMDKCLEVIAGAVGSMKLCSDRMAGALDDGLLATDLADYLVSKGLPFREAHRAVGKVVLRAQEAGVPMRELPLEAFREITDAFEEDLYEVFDFQEAVNRKSAPGGTAPHAVTAQIAKAREMLRDA
jgi:argininosuccinate lyase